MAEVGTILAIIQLADRLISICKFYVEVTRDAATSQLYPILLEVTTLRATLDILNFISDSQGGQDAAFHNSSSITLSIKHSLSLLQQLEVLLPAEGLPVHDGTIRSKSKVALGALKWSFKEEKATKILQELGRCKATLGLALTSESLQAIGDLKEKSTRIETALTEAQRREVCKWLQLTDPSKIHYRNRAKLVPGTAKWITNRLEWTDWREGRSESRCLWFHGIPGAGKTALASSMIEELRKYCAEVKDKRACFYYYCYFGNQQNETAPLLRWLLDRFCRHSERIPTIVYRLFQDGSEPDISELLDALQDCLCDTELSRVYIVVDAVDESLERGGFLSVLGKLSTRSEFHKLQILATSRRYPDIDTVRKEIAVSLTMSDPEVTNDIRRFVKCELQTDRRFKFWPLAFRDEIERILPEKAEGMFRLAVCQLDVLKRVQGNADNVREVLKTLPENIYDTYSKVIENLTETERDVLFCVFGMIRTLDLLDHSYISWENVLGAVAFKVSESDASSNTLLSEEYIREICGCLVEIDCVVGIERMRQMQDKETLKYYSVTYAHYTVAEFLLAKKDRDSPTAEDFSLENDDMAIIGQMILTALYELIHRPPEAKISSLAAPENSPREDFLWFAYSTVFRLCKVPENVKYFPKLTQHALTQQVSSLLDPHFVHFDSFRMWGKFIFRSSQQPFYEIRWDCLPSSKTAILFNRLLVDHGGDLQQNDSLHSVLIQYTMDRSNFSPIRGSDNMKITFRGESYEGNMIYVFCWLISNATETFPASGHWVGHRYPRLPNSPQSHLFDFLNLIHIQSPGGSSTDIIMLITGCHEDQKGWNNLCSQWKHILLRSVSPLDEEWLWVTPLQIAVFRDQENTVGYLLSLGADVNGVGRGARKYPEMHPLAKFNHLHGKSPLQIACDAGSGQRGPMETSLKMIANRKIAKWLFAYRARAFCRLEETLSVTPRSREWSPGSVRALKERYHGPRFDGRWFNPTGSTDSKLFMRRRCSV